MCLCLRAEPHLMLLERQRCCVVANAYTLRHLSYDGFRLHGRSGAHNVSIEQAYLLDFRMAVVEQITCFPTSILGNEKGTVSELVMLRLGMDTWTRSKGTASFSTKTCCFVLAVLGRNGRRIETSTGKPVLVLRCCCSNPVVYKTMHRVKTVQGSSALTS